MLDQYNLLRLNVGFIINQPVGYSREFVFNAPDLTISPDLTLKAFVGQARISRNPQGLLVDMAVQAQTPIECVRCLSLFHQDLKSHFVELFTFTAKSVSDEDLILPEDGVIDLGPLVREYLILDIPIKPLCQSACKGLCSVCGENKNLADCEHHPVDIDPRMSVLETLIDE